MIKETNAKNVRASPSITTHAPVLLKKIFKAAGMKVVTVA